MRMMPAILTATVDGRKTTEDVQMEGYRLRMWNRLLVCGLALLGLGGAAHADDVKVQPAPGAGFVVTDTTGASPRLQVRESGDVLLPGLLAAPAQNQRVCFGPAGILGGCVATPDGGAGLCVPDATAAPRFVDNGDGTVTDKKTCLMWEKKTGTVGVGVVCTPATCAAPHDVNNRYTWSAGGAGGTAADGTVFTQFLEGVNGRLCATSTCPKLGGHSDWRLPLLSELQMIVDPTKGNCGGGSGACIDETVFGPTVPNFYWSSSTNAGIPLNAWFVGFGNGSSDYNTKTFNDFYVRAVRGGL